MGDVWSEAGLADVFMYLLQSHSLNIPDTWLDTMMDFKAQLRATSVTRDQLCANVHPSARDLVGWGSYVARNESSGGLCGTKLKLGCIWSSNVLYKPQTVQYATGRPIVNSTTPEPQQYPTFRSANCWPSLNAY